MRAKLILMLMLAGLGAWAQSPNDYVVMRAWEHVRRAYVYPSGLVAYWSMDSRSGTTVYDTFGSNDGTAVGTPLFDSAYGKYLDGLNLNGSSQWLDIEASPDLRDGFTISAWFNTKDVTRRQAIIIQDSLIGTSLGGAWLIEIFESKLRVYYFASSDRSFVGSTTLSNNKWYHVCLSYDGTTGPVIYLDGKQDGSDIGRGAVTRGNDDGWRIGYADALERQFYGYLDEISAFTRVLSSNEVSEIYNDGAGRFYTP